MENNGRARRIWTSGSSFCRPFLLFPLRLRWCRRWRLWRRPLEVCLPTWETGLVFRSHLIWWFTSPSGCSLLRRGGVDAVGGVCPLLHRRGDGRWPSCLACAFIVYTACWFSRYASLGAISKLCSFFVGRVVGSKASSPAASNESNRVLLTRTCL